jgi:hypothetical protein
MIAATNGNSNVVNDPVYKQCIAAALRAAAKLEDIEPGFIGPCDESYGSCLPVRLFTERDFNYSLALEKNRGQVAAQRKLLAIANELDPTP